MFDWANDETRLFMSRGYLQEGESVEQRCEAISQLVAKHYDDKNVGKKIYEYLGAGFYSLSSPLWSNYGRSTGLPCSCNGVYVDDSIASILEKTAEIGMQTKHGAGTSAYLGAIRPRGSDISVGGSADGPVHFAELLEVTTDVISQGCVRRGNCAVYLDVTHPDINEFLDIREEGSPLQKLSFGVCIPDDWMSAMVSGDPEKREVWGRIIKKRFESGYPYIFFSDTVNRNAPDVYKDKGLRIHASNLCVAGDTKILTGKGNLRIADLVDQKVNVWNGKEFSETVVRKTGVNQKLLRIKFTQGQVLECTPYHKFYLGTAAIETRAGELTVGDKLTSFVLDCGSRFDLVVESIEEVEGEHDTYCFNEPKRHMGVFNGVLTGNCSEIALHSCPDESFVCNLMSMNLLKYDEWKGTDAVQLAVYLLDAVMEEYIKKTKSIPFMQSARRFAKRQRALGLGTLGLHSLFQSKGIAFDSTEALRLNAEAHKLIYKEAHAASKKLAKLLGEPKLLKGYGRRNVTLCAIAPTTSSSFILGQVSPSVEPLISNYFIKDLAKGKFTYRNPYLKQRLSDLGQDTEEVWASILAKSGSVQHLDFLSEDDKQVFQTFEEISPMAVVNLAAQRQQFIDQSQSINLMIHPEANLKQVNQLMIHAWESGVKTLYYQRSTNPIKAVADNLLSCVACEA